MFGDHGTGKTTLALQAAGEHVAKGGLAFFVCTGPLLSLERASDVVGWKFSRPDPRGRRNFHVEMVSDFAEFLETVSRLELKLASLESNGGTPFVKPSPEPGPTGPAWFVCVDSLTRHYVCEPSATKKSYEKNFRLGVACAWLNKISLEKGATVVLVCEERIKEEGDEDVAVPAGGRVVRYWGDSLVRLVRAADQRDDSRLLQVKWRDGTRWSRVVRLGARGFEDS